MALADLIADVAHRLWLDVIGTALEAMARWLGYILLRYVFYLGQREVEWEGTAVLVVGIVAWIAVGIVFYLLWPS